MKKRVRIYKKGGQSNAPTQEQIYKHIADRMSAEDYDGDADTILQELTQAGIDPQTADDYITEVSDYLEQNNSGQSAEQEQLSAEEAQAQAEEEQAAIEAQNAAEEKARKAQLYAMYNTDTEGTTQDDNADEEMIMRHGGSKPSKKSFINQYTKLAKRQQGGNTPSPGADDVLGGREEHVSNFFKGIGESVNLAQQKQAAEEQYNAIYGNPQVGAYAQDGGIQQEQIDTESPYDHLAKDTAARRHIFSDNMYTQNDIAALEQYGGNTGQGLYKFIGGGDNESMDEQYQDSDLDYQRYAKRGGALHKYQNKGEVSLYSPIDNHRYSDKEIAANQEQIDNTAVPTNTTTTTNTTATTDAQKQQQMMQQQMMQQYMLQQYMQQMGNQGMFRSPIISRGEQYNKAVGSPYYTESGERYTGPDLAGRIPTRVDVTKKGIFGRPKQFTVNYGSNEYLSPTGSSESLLKTAESEDVPYRGKTFGERLGRGMVNTKIPGIQQLGAKLIPTNFKYDNSNNLVESSGNSPFKPLPEGWTPPKDFMQTPWNSSDISVSRGNKGSIKQAYLNESDDWLQDALANKNWADPSVSRDLLKTNPEEFFKKAFANKDLSPGVSDDPLMRGLNPVHASSNSTWNPMTSDGSNMIFNNEKMPSLPISYTNYAYGGDISVPELYRAQTGVQMPEDYSSLNFVTPEIEDNENFPDPTEPAAKPLTKEQELLKYQRGYNQQSTYVDPKFAGENISGIGTTDNPIMQQGVSQKFRNKQAWDIDKAGIGDLSLLAANAIANTADEVKANRQENQMLENLTSAETNFGINNTYDQGDYDPNSGLFRPNKTGFMGVSKYGGGVYAMGGNTEDEDEDTQYMTQEEIDDFIANGGELEYL